MSDRFDCDVLVIGLGPVGDCMAALASLQGLKVIAVDREPGIFPLPRAAVFDHEIMRVFQMMGVAERIAPLCRMPERYQFLTPGRDVLLEFRFAPQKVSGWAESYALHQPGVEEVLRERLAELDVDIRLETQCERLEQDEDGVHVTLRDAQGESTVRARYVVSCDGAASPTRRALGVGLFDYAFDEPWLVLDTIIDDAGDMPRLCEQICDPRRPATYLAMSGNRFRWEFMLKPGENPDDLLQDAVIRDLVAPWNCADRMTIERKAIYRFHGLVAEDWKVGRILLAGDAAHQMPPFAGQGMCSGIRDTVNLAWKLAWVIRGDAGDALLDTYQTEREPHVRSIIETAIAMGKIICLQDEVAAAARDAELLARQAAGEQDLSVDYPALSGGCLTGLPDAGALFLQPVTGEDRFDRLLGLDAALIGRDLPPVSIPGLRVLDLSAPEMAPFAPALTDWLQDRGVPAVLVRPDRHVFGAGDPEELVRQWTGKLQETENAQVKIPA
ncbi:bifunctional 3-(3-hydroxy-phenyl)propionate/3-hydroxycinnamic acid hydroxylase MhpA [Novosphingobium naphthalenivorans]|uniref:bifunctional 3-(3-hydroxy-phenyl)propionate/3-hydroxycinnamic acid hydroxylase MhpA n=1 Tax=Novosphingobium naphthalenivorans TaxID=273168 RepID=UPI000833C295|nr:bifunctional 3-(3-hydroxy-phenyl)propionate/3-hydroxycinnamic acid hydroxylase [Novosphingobium naphthalenivorans]